MCYTIAMKLCGKSIGSRECALDKASGSSKRTILVAGMGTSPAVLTETEFEGNLHEEGNANDRLGSCEERRGGASLHGVDCRPQAQIRALLFRDAKARLRFRLAATDRIGYNWDVMTELYQIAVLRVDDSHAAQEKEERTRASCSSTSRTATRINLPTRTSRTSSSSTPTARR